MNRIEPTVTPTRDEAGGRSLLVLFTLTSFVSAFLLFLIQPMFTKMVLPILGGSPSVWAVALVFFQSALLAGYAYAHLLTRLFPLRTGSFVHVGVLVVAVFFLPIAVPESWQEPPLDWPYLWQLGLYAVAIGVPFLTVAANAPLLQAWFAGTGHARSADPYFLYAASNFGSFLALMGYPFLFEPVAGVSALSVYWSIGFGLLGFLLLGCMASAGWFKTTVIVPPVGIANDDFGDVLGRPTWRQRFGWIALAFVPAGLLTAFTTHLSTDIASAPLLWVVPLALYLLTFVVVFRRLPATVVRGIAVLHLAAVVLALLQLSQSEHDNWFVSSSFGFAAFVMTGLMAHRALYESRPATRFLTEFYLLMSLGGALGGLFAALIAPTIFSEVFEYPLLLALSVACRPVFVGWRFSRNDLALALLIVTAGAAAIFWGPLLNQFGVPAWGWGLTPLIVAIFVVVVVATWRMPLAQLASALVIWAAVSLLPSGVMSGNAQRSYFGVYRVSQSTDGGHNVLTHGTTLHGAQRLQKADEPKIDVTVPGTYYYPESPMARVVASVRTTLFQQVRRGRYGVVGLGAGSLACLSKPGERWRFFEIDPLMVKIAAYSGYFTYIGNCQPQPDFVLGDARLTLSRENAAYFDLLIIDAFTSDAVPVHLMTAEALKLYADKIAPDGVALLHISNRYLDLEGVIAATMARVPELKALIIEDFDANGTYDQTNSTVAVFAKNQYRLDTFRTLPGARDPKGAGLAPWTDDSSDVFMPLLSKLRGTGS
ncbi:fused MFS/spermidine synthase [Filomicrobium sp.]|uniref:spermidine synthase n=1 Tax=Filomicrobium sp. TaxID=2024831 RepID=UPI00258CDDB1|nr:fused MFS/spermidine synthase [Filomicrobium sp.]MCV0368575.1 fused MFS/spermidine synthase [Filomicrobium sp.]